MIKKKIDLREFSVHEPAILPGFGGVSDKWGRYGVNERYLTKNGAPWLPFMGEFHYSRYPEELWEESILKIKAGGVTILSTYVFWIHHEEIRGQFDWSGNRDLGRFVRLCAKHDFPLFLRIGPWSHGECRNGGFPDWLQELDASLRSNDPVYLEEVRRFFAAIYGQVEGCFFHEGGPVIGIQLENEYGHCGGLNGEPGKEHMMELKRLAQELGFITPFYTATGWGNGVVVEGETLPVLGGYADAPWAQHTKPLPVSEEYLIRPIVRDVDIGTDLQVEKKSEYSYDVSLFPYLTAELGGGIQVTGHRRPVVSAEDIEALAFTKLASGANLLGFYMYHGGTNPKGKLTTLQETRATGYPNDLPELSYDFQAPVREYGQLSDTYKHLKVLGMMAGDFGDSLAATGCYIPDDAAMDATDCAGLRYSVRLAGDGGGYVFLGNYQRHGSLAPKPGLELEVTTPMGQFGFAAVNLADGDFICLPFGMKLGAAALLSATAQPLCILRNKEETTYVFWKLDHNQAVYHFGQGGVTGLAVNQAEQQAVEGSYKVTVEEAAGVEDAVIRLTTTAGEKITILTLSRRQAEQAWKLDRESGQLLVLTEADFVDAGGGVRVTSRSDNNPLAVYPKDRLDWLAADQSCTRVEKQETAGVFDYYRICFSPRQSAVPAVSPLGINSSGAQEYKLVLDLSLGHPVQDHFLLLDFVGDRAELFCNGELAADWFYTGETWEIGLRRFAGIAPDAEWRLAVYPLRTEGQVYYDCPPPLGSGEKWGLLRADTAVEYLHILSL